MNLISVILPIYNGEKYLDQAVKSILNQTLTNFELILLNDGSSDNSEEIALSFQKKDKRVVYCKNEKNIGLIQTLNMGFSLARGRFIARMDQDDIAHPERLEIQLKFLLDFGKPGIVGTNILVINSKSEIVKIPREMHTKAIENSWIQYRKCPLHHPTIMISREIVETLYPFYSILDIHTEDYAAWLRVGQSYPIMNTEKALLFYRIHSSNISSVYSSAQTEQMIETLKIFYLNNLNIEMNKETLRSLLFLKATSIANSRVTFNEILNAGLLYSRKYGNEKFVKEDIAYTIFSIGLKSLIKSMPVTLCFILKNIGIIFLLKAMSKTFLEGGKAFFLRYFYNKKYYLLLHSRS